MTSRPGDNLVPWTEEWVQALLEWVFDHANDIGNARGESIAAARAYKRIEARLYKLSTRKSIEDRKADARDHPLLTEAAEREAKAEAEWEAWRTKRDAIFEIKSAWQSMNRTREEVKRRV